MHAISTYGGNSLANTPTNRQDRLQYTASSFFLIFLFFFLHLVLFLHLVKVCIVVLLLFFSVCTFCTNGDNNNDPISVQAQYGVKVQLFADDVKLYVT